MCVEAACPRCAAISSRSSRASRWWVTLRVQKYQAYKANSFCDICSLIASLIFASPDGELTLGCDWGPVGLCMQKHISWRRQCQSLERQQHTCKWNQAGQFHSDITLTLHIPIMDIVIKVQFGPVVREQQLALWLFSCAVFFILLL